MLRIGARKPREILRSEYPRPVGRRDAGGVQQRQRIERRAISGSGAASCGAGRRQPPSTRSSAIRSQRIGLVARDQADHGGGDLRRRHEGARRDVEQDLRLACATARAPPGGHRPWCSARRRSARRPRAGTSASAIVDQGGHGRLEPADQQRGARHCRAGWRRCATGPRAAATAWDRNRSASPSIDVSRPG